VTRYALEDKMTHVRWPLPVEYPDGFPSLTHAMTWALVHIPDAEQRDYRAVPIAEGK
jgi:hypothetical protein